MVTAVIAPAHIRSIAKPGTLCGRPASSAAVRPMVRPWSPIWVVAATATSSTRSGGSDGLRRISSRMHLMTRSSARVSAYWPLALPNGVRTPSTKTTSRSCRGTRSPRIAGGVGRRQMLPHGNKRRGPPGGASRSPADVVRPLRRADGPRSGPLAVSSWPTETRLVHIVDDVPELDACASRRRPDDGAGARRVPRRRQRRRARRAAPDRPLGRRRSWRRSTSTSSTTTAPGAPR